MTWIAPTVLAAALVAACTGSMDRSGGETSPTVLVLASSDGADTRGAPALARFVQLVGENSGGGLQVEISDRWRGKGETRVLEDVAAGKVALGWSGTRAFDTIGVDTFRPLHAPFLISSYAAQRAVLADAVAQDMLAGIDIHGLTGLALLADELRFPAAAEEPLLRAADFEGIDFGIVASNAQAAAVTALGARAKAMAVFHPPGTDGLEGLETMWPTYLANGQERFMPFVTANAVLWPRTTVIVANAKSLAALDERDRSVLTRAAREASAWSLQHADDRVADEMMVACDRGARIATMAPREITALRKEAAPVYRAMRAQPGQAQTLRRVARVIRRTGPAEPVAVPERCAYRPGDKGPLTARVLPKPIPGPGRPGRLPAGTYRYSLSAEEIDNGLHLTEDFARANAGVWTWTLADGRWSYEAKPDAQDIPSGYAGNTCEGYYDVHGHEVDFTTVTVYASGECASKTWKAGWRARPDGLDMDVTTDGDDLDFLFGAKVWKRIA